MKTKIYFKRKLLRLFNTGVVGTDFFYDKKNIQLYNIFLFFCSIIVFFFYLMFKIFGFEINARYIVFGMIGFPFSFYLNKKNRIYLSKFFAIQLVTIVILISLITLNYNGFFNFYFFLVLLYSTILFNENETKTKVFFIIQSSILQFIFLTPLKKYFFVSKLVPDSSQNEINVICITTFTLFLFLYIFFQTRFQSYKEERYRRTNYKLLINNSNIKNENIQKKLEIAVISNLLYNYFEKYDIDFKLFCEQNKASDTKSIETFDSLKEINTNIESIINYQFNKNDYPNELNLSYIDLNNFVNQVAENNNIKINLIKKKELFIHIHKDIFKFFVIEIFKKINISNSTINFSMHKIEKPIHSIADKIRIINLMGIQIVYRYQQNRQLYIALYFSEKTTNNFIYKI